MPIKGQSPKQVAHTEMHKFKHGTLHSGSKSGPVVKSRKQAIAIALSESGQSKKKGYDRSGHQPGNPGFNREGKPPYAQYNGGAHASQPQGHSIGNAPEMVRHTKNQTFDQEIREHQGQQKGAPMGDRGKVGNIDAKHGSALVEDCGEGHASQPQGHSIGAGRSTARMITGHGFGHSAPNRSGALRMSGHPGAHRIGKR